MSTQKSPRAFLRGLFAFALAPAVDAASADAPNGQAPADPAIVLSPFEVNTSQDIGYRSVSSSSGTLIAEELKNLPESISVMNQQFIRDIGAADLFELSRYATGGEFRNTNYNDTVFSFRGITTSWQSRDGFIWYLPQDGFSIDRVEVVRGPNALLYGNAQPGGLMNIISKRATIGKDNGRVQLTLGSWDRTISRLDVNRTLSKDRLAVRLNLGVQRANDWRDFVENDFQGVQASTTYRPFQKTIVRGEIEFGAVRRNQGQNILVDQFSSYPGSGTEGTTAIPVAQSSILVDGKLVDYTANNRMSLGTTLLTPDVLPRRYQFTGPSPYQNRDYHQWLITLEQELAPRLNFETTVNRQDQKNNNFFGQTGATSLRVDPNPLLPDGTPNPNFNQLYIDNTFQEQRFTNKVTDLRTSLTYTLEIPRYSISQKFLGFWANRVDYFTGRTFSETLVNNRTRPLYRRHYVSRYSADEVRYQPVRDIATLYGDGFWQQQRNELTAYSFATIGSYWKDRIHTLAGVRRDSWIGKVSTNLRSGNEFVGFDGKYLPVTPIKVTSVNYGGVVDLVRDFHGLGLSGYWNYAEGFQPNAQFRLIDGTTAVPRKAPGREFGMRLFAFGGRASLSVARYNIDQPDSRVAVSTAAKVEINNLLYTNPDGSLKPGSLDVNDGSFDKTQGNSQGTEIELVLNPTPSWTLSANYAHNYLKQRDTLPLMGAYWSQLVASGAPVSQYPNLDSFVRSTRFRDNLIVGHLPNRANGFTRYNFSRGPLKGVSLGGGVNYRSGAYLGLVDNQPFYSKSSLIFNGLIGYSGKLYNHNYSLQLNVDNVADKTYYVAYNIGSARWSNPREFRLTMDVKF